MSTQETTKQEQSRLKNYKKELDYREKKLKEREHKLRERELADTKAHQKVERERKELKKQKRKGASKQPSSVHALADTKASKLKLHLNKAHDDLTKTKQLLDNTKSTLNNKNQKMRHLKQDNTAKAEKIEFLTRQIKSMTKGK
eukprot:370609_1